MSKKIRVGDVVVIGGKPSWYHASDNECDSTEYIGRLGVIHESSLLGGCWWVQVSRRKDIRFHTRGLTVVGSVRED